MRIAVIGAGGVGGYFGALLARAHHDVVLYARGEHLDAIRARGLRIRGPQSEFTLQLRASNAIDELVDSELCIVAVKGYSLPEVTPVITALTLRGAVVLPLLNGVDAAERLSAGGVPCEAIVGGLTFVNAFKAGPGIIQHAGWLERVVLGEFSGAVSGRVHAIGAVLASAGIETIPSTDIVAAQWAKFNFICALSAACGMARRPVGDVRSTALGRLLLTRAIAEIAAVGRALGVAIASDAEAQTMQHIDGMHATQKPSFLLDVERGGPTELDIMSGTVSKLGRTVNVPTPVHDTATAVLASLG